MSARYDCLDVDAVVQGDRRLLPVRHQDLVRIMHWRNAQLNVLRQKEPLTPEQQERYYQGVLVPSYAEKQPRQILFSYLQGQELIGYGGLVHIAWEDRRAEVSFLLDPDRTKDPRVYAQDFALYLSLIKETAFKHLGFTRIFTETYDIRPHHISILESNGFHFEGRLNSHVWIDGQPVDSLMHGCVHLPSATGS
jgi:RimJ/RimL family protein N-acetyltransferase